MSHATGMFTQLMSATLSLTRSGECDEHVFAEIADRNAISATRQTQMARATPNNSKAVRKEAKLKYKLKPELQLHHPTVYCWLTLCPRECQLQGFITLTYSTNCILPLKRSVEESWPKYPHFCTTMHLLTGHMLDKLLYLNPDLNKCITHHILLTWHRVITICFQIWSNTSVDRDFPPMMSSSMRPNSGWRSSQNSSIWQALRNFDSAINCALTKAVITLKNKCMLINLSLLYIG